MEAKTEPRHTHGWWVIGAFVVSHNVWAAATRREMLSQAAARRRQSHSELTHLVILGVSAHLLGYLGKADPLFWVGALIERLVGAVLLKPRGSVVIIPPVPE